MHVAIRQARPGDQPRVTELWLHLLQEQSALDDRFGASEDAEERWANDFPEWLRDDTRRVFVAEREEAEVVGFVTAQRWAPPPVYAFSEEVYINELYVAPGARREQVGQALVDAVRAWAGELGATRLRLGVLMANEAGRAFWAEQGARPLSMTVTIDLDAPDASRGPAPRRRMGF